MLDGCVGHGCLCLFAIGRSKWQKCILLRALKELWVISDHAG
ncbi:hypothetical protein HP15_2654 [Marinobacter adhaerens HP15]|uniref:Uncharacterized protein n=1 Tax=Marinobacter adhaerens (strain DSM 23420 / HP15) TaxID=225937 RepID=E4PJQ4_MARAH|nr:hypothetical protein HP15_2654 [Marinobacter adhaerens HP15]